MSLLLMIKFFLPKPRHAEYGQDLIETLAVVPILFLMLVAAIWISGAFLGASTQNVNVRTDNALYWQCGDSPGGCGMGGGGVNAYNAVLEGGNPVTGSGSNAFVFGTITSGKSIPTFGGLPPLFVGSTHVVNTNIFEANSETSFGKIPPGEGARLIDPHEYGILRETPSRRPITANRDALKTVKIWNATPSNPCGSPGPAITAGTIDNMVENNETYRAAFRVLRRIPDEDIREDYIRDSAPDETDIEQWKQGTLSGFSVAPYAEQTESWVNSQDAFDDSGNQGKALYTNCYERVDEFLTDYCQPECQIEVTGGKCKKEVTNDDDNPLTPPTTSTEEEDCDFTRRYNYDSGSNLPYACEETCVQKHFKACVANRITGYFTAFRNETLLPTGGCNALTDALVDLNVQKQD